MRPIKFRARATKDENGVTSLYYIYSDEFPSLGDFFNHTKLIGWTFYEQFTGLHDKNGKEIWEGDVLGFPRSPHFKQVVEWKTQEWNEDSFGTGFQFDLTGDQYEVLGNIYENKELING